MFDFKAQSINTLVKKLANDPSLLVDLASYTVSQIKRYNPKFQPFVFYDENTLQQLTRDLSKLKKPVNLFGIPFGVKDIFNTEDYPTQMGSDLWKDFTPGNDARIVYYLKQQGAIIAGKTETAEFAVHALGQTLNPHDVLRTPGTSSSGSAVAVALGMVPAALGSQTAGSIIRPASFCGVYGCKPSFGLMSRTGILKTTDTLDQVGFFTNFAEDMKTIFDAIRVKGKNYYYTHQYLSNPKCKQKKADEPWRVAFVKTPTWSVAEDYARKNIADFLDNMKSSADFAVHEVELPNIIYDAYRHHEEIYYKSLAYYFQHEYKSSEKLSPIMKEIIEYGKEVSNEQFHRALSHQQKCIAAMDDFAKNYDVIICLSTAGVAPLRAEKEKPDPALLFSYCHNPVVSAPAFTDSYALPFGIQIVARKYNDYLLFDFIQSCTEMGLLPKHSNHIISLKSCETNMMAV